jgi:hypothetical protein
VSRTFGSARPRPREPGRRGAYAAAGETLVVVMVLVGLALFAESLWQVLNTIGRLAWG